MKPSDKNTIQYCISILYHTVICYTYIYIYLSNCSFDVQHAELYKLDQHALSDS